MLCRQTTLAALLCATALTAAPVQAVETDPLPAFSDLLAPNRLATFLANLAIAGLRTEMEVQYDHMSTDIMRGTVSISGVTLRPTLNYDQAGQCTITIDREGFAPVERDTQRRSRRRASSRSTWSARRRR